jgi:hypothetical protein
LSKTIALREYLHTPQLIQEQETLEKFGFSPGREKAKLAQDLVRAANVVLGRYFLRVLTFSVTEVHGIGSTRISVINLGGN